MPVFKLESFPNVCRLCLSAEGQMLSLQTRDPVFDGGTIGGFITKISFKIEQHKSHLFPQMVCQRCFELLKFFARYRSKVATVHLLMNALVELRFSNCRPLVDLFESGQPQLDVFLKDIDLCDELEEATAQTLMEEFPLYAISSVERAVEIEVVAPVCDDVVTSERAVVRKVKRVVTVEKVAPKRVKKVKRAVESSPEPAVVDVANETQNDLKKIKLQYQLRCTRCPYTSEYLREFEAHQLKEHDIKSREFLCDKPGCPEVFKDAYELYKHNVKMHKPFICDLCGHGLSSQRDLNTHIARHNNLQNFGCTYCGRRFNMKHELHTHIKRVHLAERNLACRTCGLAFTTKHQLAIHEQTHNVGLNYECEQCGKKFKSSANLKQHFQSMHAKPKNVCSYCDRRYNSRNKLVDHIEAAHRIQCRFVCDVCVQTLPSADELATHRARHDSPKELECGRCLAVFLAADVMAGHLCISYRDDYVCCERDFRYHYAYNKHMFIKHGQKLNARVRPVPGELIGLSKAKRKRIEMCHKCETIFPSRAKKKEHQEICVGPIAASSASSQAPESLEIPEYGY